MVSVPEPDLLERHSVVRSPLLVIDITTEQERETLARALEHIGRLEVRSRPSESMFQFRRAGLGELGRGVRQDHQRLFPPRFPPEVVGAPERGLNGLAGLSLSLRLRRLAVHLLLLQPDPDT